jgi:hypothetical protein
LQVIGQRIHDLAQLIIGFVKERHNNAFTPSNQSG